MHYRERSGPLTCAACSPSKSACCCVVPIHPDRPLSEYGLDSLGNLELRMRVEAETGIRINPGEITTVARVGRAPLREIGARRSRHPEDAVPVAGS